MAGITPSQTVGPFFHYGLTPHDYDFAAVFSNNLAVNSSQFGQVTSLATTPRRLQLGLRVSF